MRINLIDTQPIGQWDVSEQISQLEFQFGTLLIYLQYPKGTSASSELQAAQIQIQHVWGDIQNAINFAETWFRTKHPEFWSAWDKAEDPRYPLIAYSIAFSLDEDYPCYYIARDPGYEFEYSISDPFDLWQKDRIHIELPFFPDTDAIAVYRIGNDQFALSDSKCVPSKNWR
jgi:hypothetical protein